MSSIVTTLGLAHIAQLESGGSLDNAFDGLVLGQGNDVPSTSDTLAALTKQLPFALKLSDGFPLKGDTDARNGGKGANVWTWRFERPAGDPFVASNVAVTNYAGGALVENQGLLTHSDETVAQRYDERLVVWVNASASGEASVFTAREDALEGRVQRVVGFVARNRALSASPNGSVVNSTEVHTNPSPGQHVWTAADVVGLEGQQLLPEHVVDFTLTVERLQASTGQYVPLGSAEDLECYRHVSASYHFNDHRWNEAGGFNVAHTWVPPRGTREGTFRLSYHMDLCDDDVRDWTNFVEVRR